MCQIFCVFRTCSERSGHDIWLGVAYPYKMSPLYRPKFIFRAAKKTLVSEYSIYQTFIIKHAVCTSSPKNIVRCLSRWKAPPYGKFISHRLVARPELDNTLDWYCEFSKVMPIFFIFFLKQTLANKFWLENFDCKTFVIKLWLSFIMSYQGKRPSSAGFISSTHVTIAKHALLWETLTCLRYPFLQTIKIGIQPS